MQSYQSSQVLLLVVRSLIVHMHVTGDTAPVGQTLPQSVRDARMELVLGCVSHGVPIRIFTDSRWCSLVPAAKLNPGGARRSLGDLIAVVHKEELTLLMTELKVPTCFTYMGLSAVSVCHRARE